MFLNIFPANLLERFFETFASWCVFFRTGDDSKCNNRRRLLATQWSSKNLSAHIHQVHVIKVLILLCGSALGIIKSATDQVTCDPMLNKPAFAHPKKKFSAWHVGGPILF